MKEKTRRGKEKMRAARRAPKQENWQATQNPYVRFACDLSQSGRSVSRTRSHMSRMSWSSMCTRLPNAMRRWARSSSFIP